jgi:hypothetical protein
VARDLAVELLAAAVVARVTLGAPGGGASEPEVGGVDAVVLELLEDVPGVVSARRWAS